MTRPRLGGLSIFWQTLILLLASLFVVQLVSIALFLSTKPPRPDFNRLGDIAEALDGVHERGGRDRALFVKVQEDPPVPGENMTGDMLFTQRLAERLDVPVDRVRLFFEPDQRAGLLAEVRRQRGLVPMRRGEPLFFDTVIAGLEEDNGLWRVVETPPRPLIATWQKRMLVLILLSALALVPFAWLFARRLTRRISRLAEAADRLGADPNAPRLPEEGPAELRVTAHALNRMQERIAAYVSERTAMIGAIAHDLRTPLARIAFRIEAAPEDVRTKVQADIEQMRAMIAATIGFVRDTGQGTERLPVDLAGILAGITAQEREIGRPVDLAGEGPLMVRGDALALARLFQNLIDNALAYGGAAHVRPAREGDHAVVTVADDGPGLPPELLDRVFRPFERAEPSRNRQTGGIGLGLTIARTIAENHGGVLTLANRPGGGLEARCAFPLLA